MPKYMKTNIIFISTSITPFRDGDTVVAHRYHECIKNIICPRILNLDLTFHVQE